MSPNILQRRGAAVGEGRMSIRALFLRAFVFELGETTHLSDTLLTIRARRRQRLPTHRFIRI